MASQYLTFQRTETQTVQTNVGFRNQVIEARQLRDQPFRIYRVVPELDKANPQQSQQSDTAPAQASNTAPDKELQERLNNDLEEEDGKIQ